ncbi:MAG: SPOR domain-containing protein, partial [Bacteroidota bacterium]
PVKYTAKREPHHTFKQNKNNNTNKMVSKKTPQEKNNSKKIKIWSPIVVLMIIIALIIIFYNQHEVKRIEDVSFYPIEQPDKKNEKTDTKKTDRHKKSGESNVEKKKSNENKNIQSEEYIAQQLKEKTKKENALKLQAQMAQKDTIEALSQNKYYLVAGSFNEYQNAHEYKIKLEKKGYQAKILDDTKNNNNYYRVYIGDKFSNKKIAMDELNQLREKENNDFVWLLTK